jgi:hypothetical protein
MEAATVREPGVCSGPPGENLSTYMLSVSPRPHRSHCFLTSAQTSTSTRMRMNGEEHSSRRMYVIHMHTHTAEFIHSRFRLWKCHPHAHASGALPVASEKTHPASSGMESAPQKDIPPWLSRMCGRAIPEHRLRPGTTAGCVDSYIIVASD